MGLEEILAKIHEDTEAEYNKIIASAKAEAEEIQKAAMARSDTIISQARDRAGREVQEEKLRLVASARLDVKRQLLQAEEEVVQEQEKKAMSAVDEFIASREYPAFLNMLIDDGVKKLGDKPIVHLNARDKTLVKGRQNSYEISDKPLDCKGGAVVASADGKRRVDNTLESLLSERKDELRLKIAAQVFGNKRKSASGI